MATQAQIDAFLALPEEQAQPAQQGASQAQIDAFMALPEPEGPGIAEQARGFAAGVQEGQQNIGAGILDLALNAARFLPSEGLRNLSEQGRVALQALQSQSRREFEQETAETPTAATVGRITGEALPMLAAPQMGLTGNVVGGLIRGAGQGAALAQVPFVESENELEERVGRGLTGAAGGAAGTVVGRGIERGVRALRSRRARREAARQGTREQRLQELTSRGLDETQAERAARMEEAGFTGEAGPTQGQITREQQQQRLENTLAATARGGRIRERRNVQMETARQRLARAQREMGTGEEAIEPIVRSRRVRESLQNAERISRRAVNKVWNDAAESNPNATISTSRLDDELQEVFAEGGDEAVTVARRQMERRGTKRPDGEGPTFFNPQSARVLEEKLSQAAGRAYKSNDRKTGMFYSRLQDALLDDMRNSLAGDVFEGAKAASRKHFERFRDLKKVNQFIRGDMAADDVVPGVMGRWKADEAAGFVKTLGRETKEGLQELRGGVLEELTQRSRQGTALDEAGRPILSPANMRKTWDGIPTDVKKELFTGPQRKELDNFVDSFHELFSSVPGTVNVSQTTNAMLDWLQNAVGANKLSMTGRIASRMVRFIRNRDIAGRQAQQVEEALDPFTTRTTRTTPAPSELSRRAGAVVREAMRQELEREEQATSVR